MHGKEGVLDNFNFQVGRGYSNKNLKTNIQKIPSPKRNDVKFSKQAFLGTEIYTNNDKLPMVTRSNKSPPVSIKGDAIKRFHEFNLNMETQMEVLHRKLNGIKKRVKLGSTNINAIAFSQSQQYSSMIGKQALNAGSRSVHFQLPNQNPQQLE